MKKLTLSLILIAIDTLFLISLFYLSLYIRSNIDISSLPEFKEIELRNFYFVIFIIIILFFYEGLYKFKYDFWQETLKIIKVFFMSFFIVLTILTLTKTNLNYSRLFIIIYFSLGVLLSPMLKRVIKKIIYSFDYFKTPILIVGVDSEVEKLKKEIEKNWYLGQKYDNSSYETVILIPKGMDIDKLDELIEKYSSLHRELFILPYLSNLNFAHSTILEYSNIRLNLIEFENRLLNRKNIIIKNIFDKVVSFAILPIFLLIHILISIIIKLDSKGSIFFRQKRLGKDGKAFLCYKYRTMYESSDELLNNYLRENPQEIEYYNKYHKYQNDPRVTKAGAFLRKTSLDELPQIINVLKEDMSLVGPRPYMIEEKSKMGKYSDTITNVKPGITGLWQVSGRNNIDFKSRLKLDVWYIRNWSLWLDIVILLKTIKVVLKRDGAY